MIPHGPRTLGYYAAKQWFQWATLFVVIGLFFIGLLSALDGAKEQAERQSVELTIRNMRTGMQLAMGEALMHLRESEITSWAGSNPVRWLGTPPKGYRGECSAAESKELPGGAWCFQRERRELQYRPRRAEHLRASPGSGETACSELSWRVTRAVEGVAGGGFVGLRLEAASGCQWILEES